MGLVHGINVVVELVCAKSDPSPKPCALEELVPADWPPVTEQLTFLCICR